MTNSEEAFRLLGKAQLPDYATRSTGIRVAAGLIKHALDPKGFRLLLIPVEADDPEVHDEQSRGVSVETGPFIEGGRSANYIFVRCEDNALLDLFSIVCDEIISECAALPEQVGSVIQGVLERWRDLLGPSSGRLLGLSAIKGLLAELHVLEQLAAESPVNAIQRWTGSDRTRHDFSGPSVACEVKATATVDEVRIRVHGLAQLVEPTDGSLVLLVERLERVPVGGDSIPDAVARLVAAGIDQNLLLLKLQDSGAHAADFKAYEKVRFKTLEVRRYEVDSSFPRLTGALLSGTPGEGRIHGVEYVLDLASIPPQPLSEDQWGDFVSRLLRDPVL